MVKKMHVLVALAMMVGGLAQAVIVSIDTLEDFSSKEKSPNTLENGQTLEYKVAPWVIVQFHKKYLEDYNTVETLTDSKLKQQYETLLSRDPKQYAIMTEKIRLVLKELNNPVNQSKKSKKKKRGQEESKQEGKQAEDSKTIEEGKKELEKAQKELLADLAGNLKESVNSSLQKEVDSLQADLQKNGITFCGRTLLKGNKVKWGLFINTGIIIALGAVVAGVSGACQDFAS